MSDERYNERREELYHAIRDEMYKRTRLGIVVWDVALILLSPLFIISSVILTIQLPGANSLNLLALCRWLFGFTVLFMILSSYTSQRAQSRQLDIVHDYYLNEDDDALKIVNVHNILTNILNWLGFLSFTTASIFILIFLEINF